MKTELLSLALLSLSLIVADAAKAEGPLVTFEEGRTHVNCDFANHALTEGYFGMIVNPRISGTCSDLEPSHAPAPIVGTPLVPGVPPIAPWCDCTYEEWQAMHSLMAEQNILINPGFGSTNPVAEWAKAFNTDSTTIRSPDFWANGLVPAFEELSKERFLELK